MGVEEILASVEFLVDAEGHKKAAVLEWPVWQEVVTLLEDLEDADDRLWDESFARSHDALARLADEAMAERAAGRVVELDPDLL